ncbi:MAG: hypothetical protein M1118_02595 [Chloroflexi bacterium]|nr:hypothetical protein [Chloroflexota bacterium]
MSISRAFRETGPVLSSLTAPKASVSLVHTLATTIEAQRVQLAAASLSLADASRELALVKGREAAKLFSGHLTTVLGARDQRSARTPLAVDTARPARLRSSSALSGCRSESC